MREKRAFVANAYPGPGWQRRVANMDDEQIIAIYLELLARESAPSQSTSEEQLRLFKETQ